MIRKFTDTVAGKPRIIIIIDDPDEETKNRICSIITDETAAIPNTQPDFEVEEEEEDPIWNGDQNVLAIQAMCENTVIDVPENADETWFWHAMVSQSATETLIKLDALYIKQNANQEYRKAASRILKQISATQGIYTDMEKTLMCISHIGRTVFESALKTWQTEGESKTFLEIFREKPEEYQAKFVKGSLMYIAEHVMV